MTNPSKPIPQPGCYAVIFVSQRTPGDQGYGAESAKMEAMARQQPGFIDVQSARAADGKGITVVFFEHLEDSTNWGKNTEHRGAQAQGREKWYENYQIFHAKVERARSWNKPRS